MAKTRLQEKYLSEAVKGLMDKFNYKNVMEIPKIEKVVPQSPVRNLLSPKQKNPSQLLNSVRACRLAQKLLCAATACTTSSTN